MPLPHLDGIHLHEVRGVLALSSLDCFEQAVVAVAGNGLPCHLRAEELHHLLLQDSAEEGGGGGRGGGGGGEGREGRGGGRRESDPSLHSCMPQGFPLEEMCPDTPAGEEPGGQPEQLPASLLACPQSVVC